MTTRASTPCLPKAFITFLRELRSHNDKAWFEAHRDALERDVLEPGRALIRHLTAGLQRDFPYIVGSDAAVGGSMTRLHRDTRFGKDKSPYHSHIGLHFWHRDGKKMEVPGFFLRIAPDEVLIGTGLHQPEPALLHRLRTAIDADSAAWRKASRNAAFMKQWGGLAGESLQRVPAPWPADHRDAADLRRKEFVAFIRLPGRAAVSPGFASQVLAHWRASKPLMEFLVRTTLGAKAR